MTQFNELGGDLGSFTEGNWFNGKHGVIWYYDTLTVGLNKYPIVMREMIAEVAERIAKEAEQYMKENAPWQDRTGEARSGLTGDTDHSLVLETLVLYHTVDYGIWLETRWSGAYAIIVPTLERYGPEFMAALHGTRAFVD